MNTTPATDIEQRDDRNTLDGLRWHHRMLVLLSRGVVSSIINGRLRAAVRRGDISEAQRLKLDDIFIRTLFPRK